MSDQRLVVGLGNPGFEYAFTRHNVGFMVVDELAEALGVSFSVEHPLGLWSPPAPKGNWQVVLLKPMTYMNLSGKAVSFLARRMGIVPSQVLVIYDDMSLPFGRLRLRGSGSAGGHRGMASVIGALGTLDVPRLRVGIGSPPPGVDASAYVLSPFSEEEKEALPEILGRACRAVELWLDESLDKAMTLVNGR